MNLNQLQKLYIELGFQTIKPGLWRPKTGWKRYMYNPNFYNQKALLRHIKDYRYNISCQLNYKNDNIQSICCDIDDHNNISKEKIIKIRNSWIEFIGQNPYFIEEAKFNNGEHIYHKLEFPINKNILTKLRKEFKKKYNYDIDLPIQMRLPLSSRYKILNIKTDKNKVKIKKLYDLCNIKEESQKIGIIPYVRKDAKDKWDNDFSEVYIGAGTRWEGQLKLIQLNAFNKKKLTSSELFNVLLSKNTGSKDLARNISACRREFEYYYNSFHPRNYCDNSESKIDTYSNNQVDEYISNQYLVSSTEKQLCNSSYIQKQIVTNYKTIRKNKKKIVSKLGSILLIELIGKIKFNEIRERKIKDNLNLQEKTKENLLKGLQFSDLEKKLLKKYYNIKNIDMRRLFNSVIRLNIFEQFFHNDRGYCFYFYRVCRQYLIKYNDKSIINNLLKLIINIKRRIINNKLIINNNIYKNIKSLLLFNMFKVLRRSFYNNTINYLNYDTF